MLDPETLHRIATDPIPPRLSLGGGVVDIYLLELILECIRLRGEVYVYGAATDREGPSLMELGATLAQLGRKASL